MDNVSATALSLKADVIVCPEFARYNVNNYTIERKPDYK